MKYRDIFILLLGLLFYLYLRPVEVITGHWHLTRIDEHGGRSSLGIYSAIDIESDSSLYLDKFAKESGRMSGKLFEEGELRIGPSCWGFFGEYKFIDETFYIYEKRHGEKDAVWMGKKEDDRLCDKQKYYFSYTNVEIDLPISTDGETSKEASLELPFYCGIPKPAFQEKFGDDYLLQGYRLEGKYNFDLEEKKHKIKRAENKRDRIYRTIYADQHTPLSTFYPLIEYYRKKHQEEVYLATRNADTFSEINIFLRKLNIYDSAFTEDNPQTLNDWLEIENK